MKYLIKTHDNREHIYESEIKHYVDFVLALNDFDRITLSGITYYKEAIFHIEEAE